MKIPIPSDWDGETWFCCQVNWPDSPMFLALLHGFLSQMTRGRFWDETTGSIKEIQGIGWDVFNKNFPLVDCDGEPKPDKPDNDILHFFAGGTSDFQEDFFMSLCGYNPKAFKIENGVLYVRDFCGDWVEIGAVGATTELEYPDDFFDDVDPPVTYSACGKALAMTELIQAVGASCYDEVDNLPTSWWGHVKADYYGPGGLSVGYILNACLAAVDIDAIIDLSDKWYGPQLFDESTWQSITCGLEAWLDDTAGLPDKDTLFNKIVSLIDSEWQLDILAQAFWYNVMKGIGENDIRNQGLLGAPNTDANCDCPQDPQDPITGDDGWYLSAPVSVLVTGTGGFTFGYGSVFELAQHDIYGLSFRFIHESGDPLNLAKRNSACVLSPDFCHNMTNSDDFGENYQYCQMGPIAYAAIEDYLPSPVWANLAGKTSDIVANPVSDVGETNEIRFSIRADGAEGEASNLVRCEVRWLHNFGSPSHSA